jgi:hypothetical protein
MHELAHTADVVRSDSQQLHKGSIRRGLALPEPCSACFVSCTAVPLEDGDRISLVLSVAPLVEQYFMFRCGDPRDPELAGSDEHSWVGSTHSPAGMFSPGAMHSAR